MWEIITFSLTQYCQTDLQNAGPNSSLHELSMKAPLALCHCQDIFRFVEGYLGHRNGEIISTGGCFQGDFECSQE